MQIGVKLACKVVQKADFDSEVDANVAYSTSHLKRTWKVRFACTKHVHLRFRLSQVAFHLLDSESPLFEPSF